jgi:APA family basic amino acid/polyamine antiporter
MNTDDTLKLKRAIRLPHATAMVAGIIIGASIFVQPSEITGRVPSIGGVFLVWSISGLLTFFGVLVCAELASMFTQSGGVYIYLKEAYSPLIGFLWGWAMLWSMHSGIIAAISVIFSRYASTFLPLNTLAAKAVAIGVIMVISGINYVGVKQGNSLQAFFTLGKIIAVVFIILAGFLLGSRMPEHFSTGSLPPGGITLSGFLSALVAGLFAFGGWHMVTYNSEETVDPTKTIPRALMLGTGIVTVGYILLNAVYMYILPLDKVAGSTRIAADAADAVIGSGGGALMSLLVVFSTFGALAGIILCGPRVYYAMARDGLLFSWLGDIHPRFHTPSKAIILQAVWSSVLVATGTYRILFTRVVFTEWIFFGLMAIGLIKLRKRITPNRRYALSRYPWVPVLFSLSSFAIVIHQLATNPGESLIGLSLVLTGLPIYYFWRRKNKKERFHADHRFS